MKRKSIKYLIFVFIALFGITLRVNAANFTCNIGSYIVEYNNSGDIVGAKYDSGANINNISKYISEIHPKSKSECPSANSNVTARIASTGTFYVRNSSTTNFTCNIGNYRVTYSEWGGAILSVSDNSGNLLQFDSLKSDFGPTVPSDCPENSDAEIQILDEGGKKIFFVRNKNISGPSSTVGNCLEITDEGACNNNKNFACVWNKKDGYCNVDNLQYVVCGDAHDIPAQVPSLTSFVVYLLKIATPIILIIVSIITLVKAIMSSKEDEIKKAQNSLVRKIIAAVIIFFIISIVQFVISKFADDDEQTSLSACMNCFLNNECGAVKYYKTNISGQYYCTRVGDIRTSSVCDSFYKLKIED